ncbi:MAG TPA: SMC-Scp complex subunit ScpB [Acidobacteriaceae bacterium]|jgi:segregation and condensation protein B
MSLKAKIEAVIYASEEPVTLAQLVGLLGQEAQADLDRAAAAQQSLSLSESEAVGPTLVPDPDTAAISELTQSDEFAASEMPAGEVAPTDGEETAANEAPESVENATAESAADVDRSEADAAAAAAKSEKARAAKLRAYFREVLDKLIADYAAPESDRGLEIREVAGGFRFATKPEYHDAVRGFVKSLKPPLKLTLQALETLAVVAYKQPVTAPEISEIRGVDSSGVLGSLITRKLITTAGRKQVIGRPILYKTTKEFLIKFGLKDVAELPSIEEFEKMAGQLAEQEEIAMDDAPPEQAAPESLEQELGPETEEYAPVEGEARDQAQEQVADEEIVDGRISALPPKYDDADDPSAQEAAIQSGEER